MRRTLCLLKVLGVGLFLGESKFVLAEPRLGRDVAQKSTKKAQKAQKVTAVGLGGLKRVSEKYAW
jgi:hypothetical protein